MTRAEREAARLLDMIREAGVPVPEGSYPQRLRVGPAARSAGAWAWFLVGPDGVPLHPDVGSQWPRRRLLAGVAVSWDEYTYAWQVDPADRKNLA